MCFNNPKICKLALSRISRENYQRIICNSEVQFSDKDLYLSFVEMTKTVWGAVFKASRHFRNTSVEGVMCSLQTQTLILRRLYKYTNTNTITQIQIHEYKYKNTSVCRGSHVLVPNSVLILSRLYKSSSRCGFVIFQSGQKMWHKRIYCTVPKTYRDLRA